jgi:hypothetical protein
MKPGLLGGQMSAFKVEPYRFGANREVVDLLH